MQTWTPKTGTVWAGGQGGDDRHGFQVSLTAPGDPGDEAGRAGVPSGRGPGCCLSSDAARVHVQEAVLRPRSAPRGVRHRGRRGSSESESLANLPYTRPFFSLRPVASSVKGDDNVLSRADSVRTGRDDAHKALGTQLEQDGSFTVCQAARNLNLQEAKQPPTCCFTGLGEQQRRA